MGSGRNYFAPSRSYFLWKRRLWRDITFVYGWSRYVSIWFVVAYTYLTILHGVSTSYRCFANFSHWNFLITIHDATQSIHTIHIPTRLLSKISKLIYCLLSQASVVRNEFSPALKWNRGSLKRAGEKIDYPYSEIINLI